MATIAIAMLVAYPQVDRLDTLSAVLAATESKKIGSRVTTMTEWALLAQSYIIQLISCLV